MNKILSITAFLGFSAIALGAFGAHALKDSLDVSALKTFETAVRYQMYHVIVLLFINGYSHFTNKIKNFISWFFILGISFFSGSLYAITIGNIPSEKIWFLTPFGGVLFLIGWLLMLYSFVKKSK